MKYVQEPPDEQNERQPWEKLPGESLIWYERFRRFLEYGSDRRIVEIQNAYRKEQGKKACGLTLAWRKESTRHRWAERATAWDEYLVERARKRFEEEADQSIDRRMMALRKFNKIVNRELDKHIERLERIEAEQAEAARRNKKGVPMVEERLLPIRDLTIAMRALVEQERIEFGNVSSEENKIHVEVRYEDSPNTDAEATSGPEAGS